MKNFRTIDWLKDNKNMNNLVIFDLRDPIEYDKSRIPNAISIEEDILAGQVKEHGGRHPLPCIEEFATKINSYGVDDESTVIIYDQGDLAMAGRLWWMLRYIGLKEVYVLLGGFKAWESRNYPLSTDSPKIRKGKGLTVKLQKNRIADISDVKKSMSDDSQVLVDSRTCDRYGGEVEPIDRIPGHIPGAINLPWTDLAQFYEDDLNKAKIKEHYRIVEDYENITVYCGSGITATVNILFMEEIALSPKLYVGSYSDWITYPENKTEREI